MVEHTPYQSEHLIKTRNTTIYHSQTIANSKLHLSREVRSIATDSNNELSDRSRLIEHRKSSFKRLMAENRANLVPRMAISTILNEHINEALVDFKQQSTEPVSVQVDQDIVNTENSPKNKRKVNFKKRIVEQQHDKSYSRDSKPNFGRDPAKVEKNRMMLASFFADN